MNKDIFVKGLKFSAYTIALLFTAPIVLYQAFKNETHSFYWPILIIGALLGIAAISLGFYSIKIIMDALFDKQKKNE